MTCQALTDQGQLTLQPNISIISKESYTPTKLSSSQFIKQLAPSVTPLCHLELPPLAELDAQLEGATSLPPDQMSLSCISTAFLHWT